MNNNLIKMQEMLMRQMRRLDNDNQSDMRTEIARGNTLCQSATAFVRTVDIGMRVIEMANKYEIQKDKLSKELGVE